MKRWQVALLCIAVAVISVLGTLFVIRQIEDNHPHICTPRYTTDQVIAVAKAYAGEDCGSEPVYWWEGEAEHHNASWTTVYLGDGKWSVKKDVGKTHNILGGQPWRKTGLSMRLPGELKPN